MFFLGKACSLSLSSESYLFGLFLTCYSLSFLFSFELDSLGLSLGLQP